MELGPVLSTKLVDEVFLGSKSAYRAIKGNLRRKITVRVISSGQSNAKVAKNLEGLATAITANNVIKIMVMPGNVLLHETNHCLFEF